MTGVLRVFGGLLGTIAVGLFFAVLLPVGVMTIALYIARLWPLRRRRQ
jgi:hypothetical protein